MRINVPIMLGIAAVMTASACGGGPPPPPPGPDPDSLAAARAAEAREDSIRRAEQARQDSIQRAREEAERIRRQAVEDSIAAVEAADAEAREILAERIHFDFDRSEIKPEFESVLDAKISLLQANPGLRIRIVGHCDERGSDEYNIALGRRRALAAKQYMVNRGISADRIETDSRGEAEPLVDESNEQAWEMNRRDEFNALTMGNLMLPM